jgi:hypothetical protein
MQWPHGKQFAFTIFDDTDLQTADNVRAVYSFLSDLGFRTTKTVWPIRGSRTPKVGGVTCEDERYLKWVLGLKESAFEIALHNVTYHTSTRQETARGIETFRRIFGHYPYSLANHTGCAESIYWGRARLTGLNQVLYDALHVHRRKEVFEGHVENSHLFWGDLCKEKIKYVRNFTFGDINTLKMCPAMPYHDPARPYVNYWFAGAEGPDITSFNRLLCEQNQDQLAREGGACIVYAHLAQGFQEHGKVNNRFKYLLERISKLNGWFVPLVTLLDHILVVRGHHVISGDERTKLERRWLTHKIINTRGRT